MKLWALALLMRFAVFILTYTFDAAIRDYDASVFLVIFIQPGSHVPRTFIGKVNLIRLLLAY